MAHEVTPEQWQEYLDRNATDPQCSCGKPVLVPEWHDEAHRQGIR